MDQHITTGFAKINCLIVFEPQKLSKGRQLYESGHIRNVVEIRSNGISSEIRANCIRQTSVSSAPYSVQLQLDLNRNVSKGICTCVANKSGKCKHIAGLVHFVNKERSVTKTDHEQQWGKPAAKTMAKEKYSKVPSFQEMFPPRRPEYVCISIPPTLEELKNPSHLKTVLEMQSKNKEDLAIELFFHDVNKNRGLNQLKEECGICVENIFLFLESNEIYRGHCVIDAALHNFYNSQIVLSKEQILQVCCSTVKQSESPQWFKIRKCRVSASAGVHAISHRRTKSIDSLVRDMILNRTFENDAMRHGKKYEETARSLYMEMYKNEVKKVGVLVSHSQPWLCGSLDGVVVEYGCITKLVEIKCPKKCKFKSIVDYHSKTCNVDYLLFEDDVLKLRTSDRYYTQCQVQMYLTGLSECDLFCYSPVENGSICVTVLRDEQYLQKIIPLCENFYFEHFLPAFKNLVDQNEHNFTGANVVNQMLAKQNSGVKGGIE